MAYRRSLTTCARLVARQRFAASFSCTHHLDDRKNWQSDEKVKSFLQSRSYGCFGNNTNIWQGFGGMSFRDAKLSQFLHAPMTTSGFLLARNMSTTNGEEKIEVMSDMTNVVADKTMEVVSSQVSEVAVAAADSCLPVAALQYAIDGIHVYTGLNWWASIAITTLVIRTLSIPFAINQIKLASKVKSMAPEKEQLMQEMRDRVTSSPSNFFRFKQEQLRQEMLDRVTPSPSNFFRLEQEQLRQEMLDRDWRTTTAIADVSERQKKLFKKHGVSYFTLFTPLFASLFIKGPFYVCFILAILNMVEKVPSFQTGGISWFIDLTTADSFYILPFLSAFSFWLPALLDKGEGYIVNNHSGVTWNWKNVHRGLSALIFPLAACLPNALLCYWITSKLFFLVFQLIIRRPSVRKLLNLPIKERPLPPSDTTNRLSDPSPAYALEALTTKSVDKEKERKSAPSPSPTKV